MVLYMAFMMVQNGRLSFADLGLTKIAIKPFVAWTLLLSVVGVFIDQKVFEFLHGYLGGWRLFGFPTIDNSFVEYFDLSFGLALTAFSEEVVFRGVAILLLLRYVKNTTFIVVFSSTVFGFAHWGLGVPLIISAALWGILPAISVIKTRSIYPAIVAHYITNFVDFAGLAY